MQDMPDSNPGHEIAESVYHDLKAVVRKHVRKLDPAVSTESEIKDTLAALMSSTITLAGEISATACRLIENNPADTRGFALKALGEAFDHFVTKLPTLAEFAASREDVAGHA